jgi:hypothetical protein
MEVRNLLRQQEKLGLRQYRAMHRI